MIYDLANAVIANNILSSVILGGRPETGLVESMQRLELITSYQSIDGEVDAVVVVGNFLLAERGCYRVNF